MSGSTYNVDATTAMTVMLAATLLITAALLSRRWLEYPASRLHTGHRARSAADALACAPVRACRSDECCGHARVGPLTFVGLMGPHLAREAGLVRALPQTAGAAAIGATLMVIADWIGRTVIFPYQIPADWFPALVGAPVLMMMLRNKSQKAD